MAFGINKNTLLAITNPQYAYMLYKRRKLLKKNKSIFLRLGYYVSLNNVKIGNHVFLGNGVTLTNSSIGDHSYINSDTSGKYTQIGKFCSIGQQVQFGLGKHPTDLVSTHPSFYSANKAFKTFSDKEYYKEFEEIIIGNDVWIGNKATIMGGVTIGHGAIVASGAIVTKDVKPFEIIGGIPAKHIKYRIPEEEIEKVLETKWWEKDEQWFEENYKLFLSKKAFFDYFNS